MGQGRFSVTILGANSALPANGRHPSAQYLEVYGGRYLLDCGEGTQLRLRQFRLKMQGIRAIFISHLHGDHYFGLGGLLNSMHLLGRKQKLTICSPKGLKELIDLQLKLGSGGFQYEVEYVELGAENEPGDMVQVYADKYISVQCFPLLHRIPCFGFLVKEHQKDRKYLPEVGAQYGVTLADIPAIKRGADFITKTGELIPNAVLTKDPPRTLSYAYCTDTLPLAETARFVQGVDWLYHEATFLEADADRARNTYHSTARQAAQVARDANAVHLLIGHYSARYDSLDALVNEARSVFPNTLPAEEGKSYTIG
ncbi:MAG: ribonuclease Z [Salibacteraceae bacterium]